VIIRTLGDPVLKERARPVSDFDEKLERLAMQMTDAMDREEGVGLAATQVGVLSRIIVWRNPEEEDQLYVYVNPEIAESSEDYTTAAEGCLSLPGQSVQVTRADEVEIVGEDLEGTAFRVRLTGFAARIVQHEVDHLDGCLILDRAAPEERRRVMKEMRERTLAMEK
jgi:peptide deformylase